MFFNSITFVIFFSIFFILYWIINNKLDVNFRNIFILLSSYFFYGWWDWRFLSLIFISSISDYSLGLIIYKTKKQKHSKYLLILSILINLSILAFFKYFNFFLDSLNYIIETNNCNTSYNTLNIILPVGISFYTFQTMSYTIDIYRNKLTPSRNIISFFAFVSFFPQLVAGPIERAKDLLPQFIYKKKNSLNKSIEGLRIISWGLFKKIVIADNLGLIVDNIFSSSEELSGVTILIGSVLFSFQIYSDFSGYSDIAIGISRMLGFKLKMNFRTPYFSSSFKLFWTRWHISLSSWFKDYLYIPLGGSRRTSIITALNIIITFSISGLWHGAKITFIIWGFLHGVMLIAEKLIKLKINNKLKTPFIFIITSILWIPFRSIDFDQYISLSYSLFNFSNFINTNSLTIILTTFSTEKLFVLTITFILFILIELKINISDFNKLISNKNKFTRYVYYYLILITILLLGNFSIKPYFIYFQF